VGEGGGAITLGSGLTLNTPEGTAIVFDEDAPLGYRVDAGNPFADVKSKDWFYGDEIFRPNLDITRQELAAVLRTQFIVNRPFATGFRRLIRL
jgi:hypothetical protein